MSNSNATKYHEIKVSILDNTCFKENVPTFEILVGGILRLGLNFGVINVALYGWKCDPAYHRDLQKTQKMKILIMYRLWSKCVLVDLKRTPMTFKIKLTHNFGPLSVTFSLKCLFPAKMAIF